MADVCLSGSRCSDVLDSEAIFNYESGSKGFRLGAPGSLRDRESLEIRAKGPTFESDKSVQMI